MDALKTIEQMAADNGRSGKEPKAVFTNTATARGSSASAEELPGWAVFKSIDLFFDCGRDCETGVE